MRKINKTKIANIKKILKKIKKIKKRVPPLKPMTLVKHVVPFEYQPDYPWDPDDTFIYLGEINNMLGHGVFARYSDGRIFSGYHIEDFRELSDDEI